MTKSLEAHDKLIGEIFSGSYQFEIPHYQRPYAWTTEQTEDLLSDLVSALYDSRSPGVTSQYFLGSIVLIKSDRQAKSSVVDGQQRLSTLTMLFAVLRALIPNAADDITDFLYKKGKAILGQTNEYRLTARAEDTDFFRTFIQEPGGVQKLVASTDKLQDSRLRFRENATFLLEKLSELPVSERIALLKFLVSDCSLVVISTPDLEAAYRIFSVLNNRGLDLEPIDIIKAAVLGAIRALADDAKSQAYAKKWSQIESGLGRSAFGDLFVHIRAIYAKKKQRATLVKEFQDYVSEYSKPIELIDKVIEPYAEVWGFVRGANLQLAGAGLADIINEHLAWLNRVDFKDWVPPALVYFERFRQQPQLLAAFFGALERLTYFMLVSKVGINQRIEVFAELTTEVQQPAFTGDVLGLKTLALTQKQKNDFMYALDGDIYDALPKARMALVLRVESLLRAPGLQLQNAVSLEHVLPQTPADGSQWLQCFPDEDERQAWTHRLANLVLLDRNKNSAASNYDFVKKKDVYFTGKSVASPFVLTQDVRAEASWTPGVLQARQTRLLSLLTRHWDL